MQAHNRFRTYGSFMRQVGFTLAEILIALALIAVLAAVLLPAVAGQISKGDAGRTMQDLDAVRSGIDQFLADVHRYPMKYKHLSTKIVSGDMDVNGTKYPAGLLAKWGGPYINKDIPATGLPTGFGATIMDSLVKVTNTNAIPYVTIRVVGIDSSGFVRLDNEIDGPTAWATAISTGVLRWVTGGGSNPDTTKYLATPIQ